MREIFFAKNTTDQKVCRGMWNVEFYTKILMAGGGGDVYSLLSVYSVHSSEETIYSFTVYKQL